MKLAIATFLPCGLLGVTGAAQAQAIGSDGVPASQAPVLVPVQPQAEAGQADTGGYYYMDDYIGQPPDDLDGPAGEGYSGPVPDVHVVRSGDTLWDLSQAYFSNPWEWPKVWSYNAQITNPHWIYPGDQVRLLPEGLPAEGGAIAGMPTTVAAAAMAQPAPIRRFGVGLRQLAFVDVDELEAAARIDGGVVEKELLADGDTVYLAYPEGQMPRTGERFAIYEEKKRVKHPDSGEVVGSYVRILGELEVVSAQRGKRARAIITDSNDVIERGDRVGPLQRTFKTVEPSRNEVSRQGTVVAMLKNDELIGEGEIVFLDLGAADGVKVGNRMFVVRRGDAYAEVMGPGDNIGKDDRRFPARAIGEVLVVQTGDEVAVGLVTLALQEMGVGDLVLMRAAP